MISRRKFFSIGIMMFVLFFLLQFFMVMRDGENTYDVNKNLLVRENDGKNKWEQTDSDAELLIEGRESYVVFIGAASSEMGVQVSRWCAYTKQSLLWYQALDEFPAGIAFLPKMMILESEKYVDGENLSRVGELVERGVICVFGSLEDADKIRQNDELMELLGIRQVVSNHTELKGVRLFEGLLLGGETTYEATTEKDEERQDMDLDVPWYEVRGGTKVYLVGLLDEERMDEEDIDNEDLPTLIWRNGTRGGFVFAVCGDYLKDSTAIGILDGMMAETEEYVIYPVVNAQNLSVVNFPAFANENNEKMLELYSRSIDAVAEDIIWPALVSLADQSKMKMTCYIQPQADYLDEIEPNTEKFTFFLKQMNEQGAEAALSLGYVRVNSLEDKLTRDKAFFSATGSKYLYGAAFVGQNSIASVLDNLYSSLLKDTGTLLCEYTEEEPVVSYCADSVVLQQATSDGVNYTYSDDLRMRSIQTALGYTNVILDIQDVFWPGDTGSGWETVQERFASNLTTYWRYFSGFESTTLSQSNERVRAFLNLDYTYTKAEGQIILETSETDTWFLLRGHGQEIDSIEGGSLTKLETDVYLIQAQENTVILQLGESRLHYYQSE